MRFYLALWASKFYLLIQKIIGQSNSDKAGLLAARICPEILTKVNKPKIVIAVTGTNGKTTVSHLIYDILKQDGKKIGFNEWNANNRAGHIRCLIDSVNIFNKPNKDIALLECDEMTSDTTFPEIRPTYVIVTNICRDSIRRNSYPEFIFNKINDGVNKSPDSILLLQADDPISSFLGEKNKKIFVSVNKLNNDEVYRNISPDFIVCPKCNSIVDYEYKHYRHIGKFRCPKCNLESFKGDYVVTRIDDKSFTLNDVDYPKLSDNLFNIFNESLVIVLLKELGYDFEYIKESLKNVTIPKSRENLEIEKGINIYSQMAKGQNSSALSTVLENLSKLKNRKQIVLLLDEVYDNPYSSETITWLYDSDFELLNKVNLEKIVVTGPRYLDYIVRLKLAGVPENKIEVSKDYKEAYKLLNLDKKSDIYVLYEVEERPMSREVVELLKERIRNEVE
jgi:UDP-N-acetylmuramyl tripeptide synthase